MSSAARTQAVDIYQRSNLTRLQLLFWVGHRLRPDTPLFNTIHIFTIQTAVDPVRFRRAFEALVEQSDALRTIVEEKDGVPQQKVIANFSHSLDYIDYSQSADAQETFERWLHQRCLAPFDLEKCLFDSALIKINSEKFVWYINQHHIMTDAASFFLLFERLAALYEMPLDTWRTSLATLHAFAEYNAYERAYRNSPQYSRAAMYWERKLTPQPDPIMFFGPHPVTKTSHVQRLSHDLGIERSQKLRQIARKKEIFSVSEEFTFFNIFAGLFFAQLHTLSGNGHLGLLTPVHNRFTPTFKNIIGPLMEFCPLQVEISADESFSSLISKVKRETRETFTHYQYGSGLPLQDQAFDVIFNMYQVPALHLNRTAVQVERIHPGYGSERLALHVNDIAQDGNFVLHFDFSADVFNEEQREQMVRNFLQLVDSFLEDNKQSIAGLDHLNIGRNSTLLSHNDTNKKAIFTTSHSQGLERSEISPRDEWERKLVQIWERVLGTKSIGLRENFFDLGGSSWIAVHLFAEIGRVMGVTLPLQTLLEAPTVEKLAAVLRRRDESATWSPLVAIQSTGTKRPFFCVHGAGGHILLFDKVARHLGADQPFFAFQARGIELGQTPFTRIEDMAAFYIEALRVAQPSGPYLLGGYSMGGMVAFEMAHQLLAQGQTVALVTIIDAPAQHPGFRYLRQFAGHLGSVLRKSADEQLQLFLRLRHYVFRLSYLGRLGPAEKVAYLRRKLGGLNSGLTTTNSIAAESKSTTAIDVEEDANSAAPVNRRIRYMYDVNERAFCAYIPRRYPGRVAVIRSTLGYTGDPDRDYSPDPYIGWDRVISGTLESYEVPGNHNEMIREPHVQRLAEHLRRCFDNTQHQ